MICNKLVDPNCSLTSNPQGYANNIIQTAFSIFIIIAILFFSWNFIHAGLTFITSNGDAKKIESAKSEILNAFVGLIVVFSVFAILRLIGYIFGVQGLSNLNLAWPTL